MKKKITVLLTALMIMVCSLSFIGCGDGQTANGQKVMNLSLNPKVEFILDADDKVVSVNALNEEGNLIISAEVFTGKTAEEAAKLFVKVSKETGFIVSGKVSDDENELEISLSGDAKTAETLYSNVKSKVQEYLTAENITATIEKEDAISKEDLKELVLKCAPYLEETKVKAMEYNELVKTLYESRKETAKFYSQELKNAYYEAKAFAVEQVEIQEVKAKAGINGLSEIAFDKAYNLYLDAVELVENARMTMLVNEDSPYQTALKLFREAKTEYLNYRNYVASLEQNEVTTAISAQLEALETNLDTAEEALLSASATANTTIDTVKTQLKATYDFVVSLIEGYSEKANQYATEIATKQKEAQETFFANFEEDYALAISSAKANWNSMKEELEKDEVTK